MGRCSGLVDVAPEIFWDCTGKCAALYTISTDLIVSTHAGESLKHGKLQADITTLTKQQSEELQELITEAKRKECDPSTESMAHHGDGLLRKWLRRQPSSK